MVTYIVSSGYFLVNNGAAASQVVGIVHPGKVWVDPQVKFQYRARIWQSIAAVLGYLSHKVGMMLNN